MREAELLCEVEVRHGVVWIVLRGALRASAAGLLAAGARDCDRGAAGSSAIADLSGLEVADALGVEALERALSAFSDVSIISPPPWTQACSFVHAYLAGVRLVERPGEIDREDRRRFTRTPTQLPALLDFLDERPLRGVTVDLSRGGACVSAVANGATLDARGLKALVGAKVRLTIEGVGVRDTPAQVVRVCADPLGLGIAFQRARRTAFPASA